MTKIKKRSSAIAVAFVALMLLVLLGCDSAGAGGAAGGGGDPSAWGVIAAINPEQAAQVPGSLENAKTGGGASPTSVGISSIVDTSTEKGVFGRIMQDLLYNHLLDLVENPVGSGTSRMFMALLKDITQDSTVPFALDTPIDLGVRTLPAGTSGPDGETVLDMGTLIVTEPSSSETVVHWSVPFASLSDAPDGGVYYIRLNLIQTDPSTLRFETRMGFQPNDASGNPTGGIVMSQFDAIDTAGGIYSYQWGSEESQTFQQYTDSDGMLRTFFNTMVRRGGGEDYDLLFLMIGDDTGAAIDAYQYDQTNPTQRSFEAYNQQGSLISQTFYGTPQPYRYPLKFVTKSGHTLNTDGSGNYWLDSAGDDSFDTGVDIDLTAGTAGVDDYIWDPADYDPNRPWDVGEYSTWVSGKEFAGESLSYLRTDTEITELDSASQVADLQALLDGWLGEISSTIDLGSNDILTFPAIETDFRAALGLPLDPAVFPTP